MAAPILTYNATEIIFENCLFSNITPAFILANSASMPDTGSDRFFLVQPDMIDINTGTFSNPGGGLIFPPVWVQFSKATLAMSCSCNNGNHKLCIHQAQVLYNIMERPDLRLFFDTAFRHEKINAVAKNYGLEQSPNPDGHFELLWQNKTVRIEPRMKELQPVNEAALKQLAEELLPPPEKPSKKQAETLTTILVFSAHKYYQHLQVGLYEAAASSSGKIKNPLQLLNAEAMVWTSAEAAIVKFYTGVVAFTNNHQKTPEAAHLQALRAIVNNPLVLPAYWHNPSLSDNIGANSLVHVQLALLQTGLQLSVYLKGDYYEISGQLTIGDKSYALNNLPLKYGWFIHADGVLHLVANLTYCG